MDLGKELRLICIAWGILAVPVALTCCLLGMSFWRRRKKILPHPHQTSAPWSAVEVFLVFSLWMLLPQLIAANLLQYFGDPAAQHERLVKAIAPVLAFPFFLAGALLLLRFGSGTQLYQLGLHPHQWRRSVFLAGHSWLAATLLIFLFYALVVWGMRQAGQRPEEHDLAKLIRSHDSPLAWTILILSALIVAPVVEEILFRGVIQRWAAKEVVRSHMLFTAAMVLAFLVHGKDLRPASILFFVLVLVGYLLVPIFFRRRLPAVPKAPRTPIAIDSRPIFDLYDDFISPAVDEKLARFVPYFDLTGRSKKARRVRGIMAAALLFGVLHVWPSPLPLFFLGLLLGWLAQRTQSLIGPIVLHMLFNGVTCLELALGG